MANSHNVKIIRPPNLLRYKVGTGGLPKEVIDDAQNVIIEQRIDIRPYLGEQLTMLDAALTDAQNNTTRFDKKRDNILKHLAMLKAHGGMFGFDLITEIAEIAMVFTEKRNALQPAALDMLRRHHASMQTILDHNITGDGGDTGYTLAVNLYKATQAYVRQDRQ